MCDLKPSVRDMVAQKLHMMPAVDVKILVEVKLAAVAIGKAQSEFLGGINTGVRRKITEPVRVSRPPGGAEKLLMMIPPPLKYENEDPPL